MTDSDNIDTDRLPLRAGEAVELDNQIRTLRAEWSNAREDQRALRDEFYANRMLPLESKAAKANSRSSIAMALSIVSVSLVTVVLVLVVMLHALR